MPGDVILPMTSGRSGYSSLVEQDGVLDSSMLHLSSTSMTEGQAASTSQRLGHIGVVEQDCPYSGVDVTCWEKSGFKDIVHTETSKDVSPCTEEGEMASSGGISKDGDGIEMLGVAPRIGVTWW